jgi:hypothetical protein
MTVVILLVALLGWFGGYHYGRNPHVATADSSSKADDVISAPKWLFYLCGAPVSSRYPKGVLIVSAVRAQIMSILLAMLALVIEFGDPVREIVLLGFGLAVFLPYLIIHYLYKRNG